MSILYYAALTLMCCALLVAAKCFWDKDYGLGCINLVFAALNALVMSINS